jgi:cyclophilin family peptidyl-prolyl cis-trans isomerase
MGSKVDVGDAAPEFELPGTGGRTYRLSDYRGRKVVLAFYPGDFTAVVETNCGTFDIALATSEALTIANSFAYLAEEGFYDELTFHRIVPEFVIQGGDPEGTGGGGPGYQVVQAPPKNLKYTLGTVAMAKTSTAPAGAAGSQFYVVSGPQGETLPPEYALAGKVTKGLDVVERIGELGGPEEKPTQPVVIEKMTIERG